jgi:hypothetical protein
MRIWTGATGVLPMDEYLLVTVKSYTAEGAEEFKKRLIVFWSHMIRDRPTEYQDVYAETTRFEPDGDRLTRKYLVAVAVADVLEAELGAANIDFDAIDPDDRYSKFESEPDARSEVVYVGTGLRSCA